MWRASRTDVMKDGGEQGRRVEGGANKLCHSVSKKDVNGL